MREKNILQYFEVGMGPNFAEYFGGEKNTSIPSQDNIIKLMMQLIT
jgi:hypothetical protein